MYGRRMFGGAYWGAAYFGDGGDIQASPFRYHYMARAPRTLFVARLP